MANAARSNLNLLDLEGEIAGISELPGNIFGQYITQDWTGIFRSDFDLNSGTYSTTITTSGSYAIDPRKAVSGAATFNFTRDVDLTFDQAITDDQFLISGTGNDSIAAAGGADWIQTGRGDDTLQGGAGEDRLLGGQGIDILRGGADADILIADGVVGAVTDSVELSLLNEHEIYQSTLDIARIDNFSRITGNNVRIPEYPAGHSDDIRPPKPGHPATCGALS